MGPPGSGGHRLPMTMDWVRLLSRRRLGSQRPSEASRARTSFQRDYDRIVFTSAFRRMQDKTQVFPLAESDYVRTRLTHSLEVSSVGRTLGSLVGEVVVQRHGIPPALLVPADFGAVVAAACLAHDLGNPPFGHSGEDAIRSWFRESATAQRVLAGLAEELYPDFLAFEGNAQGFRILSRLQGAEVPGGLQLTGAVLGTFSKYPRTAGQCAEGLAGVAFRKHGFFRHDAAHFREVAEVVGLLPVAGCRDVWYRHPLAWLVEAADDICYRIIDIEDGFREGHLRYDEVHELLWPLASPDQAFEKRYASLRRERARIEYLRARAINEAAEQVSDFFLQHEADFLAGQVEQEILAQIPAARALAALQELAVERLYFSRPVVEIAAAGYGVLGGLLEAFVAAVEDLAARGEHADTRNRMLAHLLPEQLTGGRHRPAEDPYERLLGVTDFVSGMTDSFAVSLYKMITGISLPGR